MILYFLRHADAVDGTPDYERTLSKRGINECNLIGEFLRDSELTIDLCFASPLVRTQETARILTQILGLKKSRLQTANELTNDCNLDSFLSWIKSLPDAGQYLLVGHEPTTSERIRALLGIPEEESFSMPKAGLAGLEKMGPQTFSLKFFIKPSLLNRP